MTVKQLRQVLEDKNLKGKGLKKQEMIDLLEGNNKKEELLVVEDNVIEEVSEVPEIVNDDLNIETEEIEVLEVVDDIISNVDLSNNL